MAEFEHNGVSYTLLPTTEWDFRDGLFAKHASGGMSVVEIEQGVMRVDPDAVIGMMAVSIHRERTTVTAAKLREEIENGGMAILAFFEQLGREEIGDVEAVTADDPPAEAAEAADGSATVTDLDSYGVLAS